MRNTSATVCVVRLAPPLSAVPCPPTLGRQCPGRTPMPFVRNHTNPKERFATKYGELFESNMNRIAPKMGIQMPSKAEDSVIEMTVHMPGDSKDLRRFICVDVSVDILVKVKGVKTKDLKRLVEEARGMCAYKAGARGNVTTNIRIEPF